MSALHNKLAAGAAMALIAGAVFVGAIFSGAYNERAAWDQRDYHIHVIQQFSRQFPDPDLSDYRSATGPGYHLVLAVVHRFITTDERTLRAVGSAFGVALCAILGFAVAGYLRWWTAVACCLPAATSLYVFGSAVWLLPDDCSWLTVLIAIILALRHNWNLRTFFATAAVLAAAVFVRQTSLWLAGPLLVSALLPASAEDSQFRWRRGGLMLLSALSAILLLGCFYYLWDGLTPPAFQKVTGPLPPGHSGWQHVGPNAEVPAMTLAVFGATGLFFTGFIWTRLRQFLVERQAAATIAVGLFVGFASATLVPTEFSHASGRYSGLWNLSARFPVIGHRSVLMAALAALGGMLLAAWFLALDRRDRWVWLTAWLCFIAAQTANAMAWQKYYEPFCLLMLALAAGKVAARDEPPRWAPAGPLALAAALACVTLWTLTRG